MDTVQTDEIPEYQILYVGQQRLDEIDTFVFDIAPKNLEKGKRYFQGRVWVDDHDFQIVKTYGKTVPDIRKKHGDEENLFPKFTTWRWARASAYGTVPPLSSAKALISSDTFTASACASS